MTKVCDRYHSHGALRFFRWPGGGWGGFPPEVIQKPNRERGEAVVGRRVRRRERGRRGGGREGDGGNDDWDGGVEFKVWGWVGVCSWGGEGAGLEVRREGRAVAVSRGGGQVERGVAGCGEERDARGGDGDGF